MTYIPTPDEEKRYAELQRMAIDFAREDDAASLGGMIDAGLPVNLADHKGNTLLMLACYNGNLATARMLLEHGAAPDRRNDRGQTPLGGAAFKGCAEIVELLLDHGADMEADNGAGMTPVMFAAMFGRTAVVELLQRRGASVRHRARLGLSLSAVTLIGRLIRPLHALLRLVFRKQNSAR